MIVLRIAFRNLLEHKTKTAIVGFLIAFAIFFMVAGNSLMDSVTRGLRESFAENYTGDLIVHGVSEDFFSLMPVNPTGSEVPVVPGYDAILAAARAQPAVTQTLPLISGAGTLAMEEETLGFSMFWGVDFAAYRRMFPEAIEFLEGGFPPDEGPFVLLSVKVRDEVEAELGRKLRLGEKITVGGTGTAGMRLREAEVAGVFRFRRGNEPLSRISLIDAATLRSLKSMSAVSAPSGAEAAPVGAAAEFSEDDLFGSGELVAENAPAPGTSAANLDAILGDTSVRDRYAVDDEAAWNFLLVRLKDAAAYDQVRSALAAAIGQAGVTAEVDDWRWGAGMMAELAYSIQIVFNVIVLIVSIVAIIIIMNTLVISVTERIPEIGTIRAIGGKKNFVRAMILWETLSIALVFGILGILLGALAIGTARLVGIPASNLFFELLFGGATLYPSLSFPAVAYSLLATVGIGVASSLYPTMVALKINPVVAMQRA